VRADLRYYASPIIPLIVDPRVAAWIARGDFVSFVATRTSLRQRRDSSKCYREKPDSEGCDVDTESFWRGHTSIVATSAGTVCANHSYLPLGGHPIPDAEACALVTTDAVATGVPRLTADRHYTTDVLAGFGVGFGAGYAVPTLLHYTGDRNAGTRPNVSLSVSPGAPCTGACLKVAGSF
jgi:hypothetical protein